MPGPAILIQSRNRRIRRNDFTLAICDTVSQDVSRGSGAIGQRVSVLDCGGPPPLFSAPSTSFVFFKPTIAYSGGAKVRLFCGILRVPAVLPKRQRAGAVQDLADQWRGLGKWWAVEGGCLFLTLALIPAFSPRRRGTRCRCWLNW